MISGWSVAAFVMVLLLFGVTIVLLMRINTQNEIIIRAIPMGSPKVQERPRPAPPADDHRTRPVGTPSTGRHG